MKAERLLSALLLLQARGRMTGREISERLEVSQRTVHRDMEALSAARVPVTAIRGAQGGWQLDKDWRTQVPALDTAELSALLMSQPRTLGDPKLIAAAERAFGKLMAALPGSMRQQAAAMQERLHIDSTAWRPYSEDLSMLPLVQDAVARDCKLTFDYTRADGEKAPRTVDPLGLVAKGSAWYLVARASNGMRTYRVSRMERVSLLATRFERPAHFDLAVFWKNSTTQLQQQRKMFEVVVCVDSRAARTLNMWCPVSPGTVHPDTPVDWLTLKVDFDSEDQACFVIMGFGSRAIALEPQSVAARIRAETKAIVDRPPLASVRAKIGSENAARTATAKRNSSRARAKDGD